MRYNDVYPMIMNESSEDKLARKLAQATFEEMSIIINRILLAPPGGRFDLGTTTKAYEENGWTRREFHREVIRRGNRG